MLAWHVMCPVRPWTSESYRVGMVKHALYVFVAWFVRAAGFAANMFDEKPLFTPQTNVEAPRPLGKTWFHLQRPSGSFHVSLRECKR